MSVEHVAVITQAQVKIASPFCCHLLLLPYRTEVIHVLSPIISPGHFKSHNVSTGHLNLLNKVQLVCA